MIGISRTDHVMTIELQRPERDLIEHRGIEYLHIGILEHQCDLATKPERESVPLQSIRRKIVAEKADRP